ncbi:MAG: cob(I)alamin adenosyltransferase [Gammaproteobacteria bacterium]|jgi:cob(I)alamin adenosyltransferase
MGNRLSKIYTKTGDHGETGLGDGSRIDKTAARVMAMGDVDELNSVIGLLVTQDLSDEMLGYLQDIQHVLFNLGGELSIPGARLVEEKNASKLETLIDMYNEGLPPLKEFILPGGNQAAAICHMARAVCRRAERSVVQVGKLEDINLCSQIYLNRLSDLLFVMARIIARQAGGAEIFWQKDRL